MNLYKPNLSPSSPLMYVGSSHILQYIVKIGLPCHMDQGSSIKEQLNQVQQGSIPPLSETPFNCGTLKNNSTE